jgi:double-strand break repair protein MRE11
MRPREATDDWFNVMLLHQNRVAHSPKNFIPEQMLENFLDLIIWGHEHECKIVPAPCSDRDFYITQPGSSIATSLSEYEAKKKFVKHPIVAIYLPYLVQFSGTWACWK